MAEPRQIVPASQRRPLPRSSDPSGWSYDPGWRAFTTYVGDVQHCIFEEQIHVVPASWADDQGLDEATRDRLVANPTPLSYNGTESADA